MIKITRTILVLCLLSSAYAQSGTKAWYQVLEVKGTANKQTDLFQTKGSKWRIKWVKPKPENRLTICIYDKEGKAVSVILTSMSTQDDSYVHKSGDYYLDIMASDEYSIIVEDWR